MSKNAAVKTLYTARFFENPSSSEESTHPSSSKPHFKGLFQTHVALNQMEEVPGSRPTTPENVDPERVETLRKQVLEAFDAANGNPASGKWGLLTNLLQTGMAKGKYRYINTTPDALPPKPGPDGWFVADTEEEWVAWEQKRKEQLSKDKLNEKVETWRGSVDADPPADTLSKVRSDDSEATSSKGSSRHIKPVLSEGVKPQSKTASRPRSRKIAELPEAFLPPSFPSQLKTSTPPTLNRSKPSPIELVPSSSPLSPPILSPRSRRNGVPGPSSNDAKKSPNLLSKFSPADNVPSSSPLSSPPKNSRVYGRSSESPLKRARSSSPTPDGVAKKTRAALPSSPGLASSSAPTSPVPSKFRSKAPFTPPRNALPKLTDLIAASAQKQKSKAKAKGREKGKAKEIQPLYKPKSQSPPPPQSPQIPAEENTSESAEEQRRLDVEAGIDVIEDDVIEDDVINWDFAADKTTAGLDMDPMPSPTKSLSSIDGSNSLESQDSMGLPDFSHGAPFDPQAGSTQPMGRLEGAGESLGTTERGECGFGQPDDLGYTMRYESQMDVESNMQGVEQMIDADVGGPWMGRGVGSNDDEEEWGRGIDTSP
ncbi:hypothetical protein C8R44DRAFT_780496 [Mycena epipterygia]|nr:hypothetical protein C8R44DRAFT_780496 [Mycena epipterygia]